MSISLDHKVKYPVKPDINHQLLGINDNCLVIQHFNINLLLSIGWGACLIFWLIGLPMILLFIIGSWLPPYGYRDGVEILTFYEKISGYPIMGFLVYVIFDVLILAGGMVVITLGMSYLNLRGVKKSFSPITFNRRTQTVSIYADGEKEEIEWHRLGARTETVTYTSGYVPHRAEVLRLVNIGKKTQIEGNLWVEALDDSTEHTGAESLWEYIRQFMEHGPNNLNVAAAPTMGIDHLDKQLMYSFDFKKSLKSHWFWPIVKQKNPHAVDIFFRLLFWPIKVVLFIPNLFTDWLWRKMCLKILKDSKSTPRYSLDKLDGLITLADSERVLAQGEDSLVGNTYAEIKRRLA